jgi:hypothetical protein
MQNLSRRKIIKKAGLSVFTLGLVGFGNNYAVPPKSGILDFEAFKDGKKDATSAIQQAVDSKAGDIYFPKGVYRITETVTIDLNKVGTTSISGNGTASIIMEGAGPAFKFVGTHQGTASPLTVKDNVWERQRTPMVDGIEIVGAHPEAVGIEAAGTMQLTITRTSVRAALHAVHLVKRNRNVIISECHFYNNRGVGVFLDNLNLHQINIVNCHISYNEGGGVVMKGTELRNLQIGSCDIEANMGGSDSAPSANIHIDSTGGSGGEVEIMGCTIQHSHKAPGSTNIFIEGKLTSRSDSDEDKDGYITITGNVISDAQINLDIRNARGLTVTGNTMWMGHLYNMIFRDCENFIVSNNVLDRNPRYHPSEIDDWKLAVLFTGCNGGVISGNHIHRVGDIPVAMTIRNSRQINMTNCNILDFGNQGLVLENVTDSRVSGCLIRENRPKWREKAIAMRWKGGEGNMIVNNLLGNAFVIEPGVAYVAGNVEDGKKQIE